MNKKEFMAQYMLARASKLDNISLEQLAKAALKAYELLELYSRD